MFLTNLMAMWMKVLGPLPDSKVSEPVRHADFCRCRLEGCWSHEALAPLVWNRK